LSQLNRQDFQARIAEFNKTTKIFFEKRMAFCLKFSLVMVAIMEIFLYCYLYDSLKHVETIVVVIIFLTPFILLIPSVYFMGFMGFMGFTVTEVS